MRASSQNSMFSHITEQLQQVEQELEAIRGRLNTLAPETPLADDPETAHVREQLETVYSQLQDCTSKFGLSCETHRQLHESSSLEEVVESALTLVWQKSHLSCAAIILGEAELGPFYYYGIKGVINAWRYIKKKCPFPLSGVLARALLRRLDASEPDYLYIADIQAECRPLPDELPWMSNQGSLLIIPLRADNLAYGAIILGHNEPHAFASATLREEYFDIGIFVSNAVQTSQMRQEMAKNTEQLINAQILTREMTNARCFQDVISTLTLKIPEVIGWVEVQVYVNTTFGTVAHTDTLGSLHGSDPQATNELEETTDALLRFSKNPQSPTHPAGTQRGGQLYALTEHPSDMRPEIYKLFQWTMQAGEPVFYDEEYLEENPEHPFYSNSGRALIVPIIGNGQTYGVIHVTSLAPLRRFEESDMVLLRTISNSAAVALRSVELVEAREDAEAEALFRAICEQENLSTRTTGHTQRVVHNALSMADALGLAPEVRKHIQYGAALHDAARLVAKGADVASPTPPNHIRETLHQTEVEALLEAIGINNHVLQIVKLQFVPYTQMSQADIGGYAGQEPLASHRRTLQSVPIRQNDAVSSRVSDDASQDRYMASNLTISQIGAGIIQIVDTFDKLYRERIQKGDTASAATGALEYLRAQSGTLFHPELVQRFVHLYKQEKLELPSKPSPTSHINEAYVDTVGTAVESFA